MSRSNDDHFRLRPGTPKQRGDAFINKVLRQTNKAGAKLSKRVGETGQRPGSRLGRGHVAARFAGAALTPNARRVTIKARLVNLSKAGPRSTVAHLRYVEREGVDRQGGPGHAYAPTTDAADTAAFEERGREDRHQFRFIVSPENAEQLDDLRTYTRHLMARMEADLGTRLDWVAVDHWNTDNPHTHVVLRGRDDTGKDLIISRDYIAVGMRYRAAELVTEWLGPRTELEIQQAMQHEVDQERWTGLDRTLQREAVDGLVLPKTLAEPRLQRQRQMLIGRLQRLLRMGLATEQKPGVWAIHAEAEPTLRAMGERGDIIRTMQRAMSGKQRELAVFQPGEEGRSIVGRVAAKGLADELYDKGYLVVDGTDGKAHYVTLPPRSALEQYPLGAIVEAKVIDTPRAAARRIADLANSGTYRSEQHLTTVQPKSSTDLDPAEQVKNHQRKLVAHRHAGIVERISDGALHVPPDLIKRSLMHDTKHHGAQISGLTVTMKCHLTIQRQTSAIGVTWLDQQLIEGGRSLNNLGFGAETKTAMRQRVAFLMEQGLAQRQGARTVLTRNLLAALRERELASTAQCIAAETGRMHLPLTDGQSIQGVVRQSVQLVSGRFAVLDDGKSFSLVPWRPVLEARLGQQVTAIARGSNARFDFERLRSRGINF